MKLLILAGGSGTRLWPLSRAAHPKQVRPFFDSRTLLQHTWARLRTDFSAKDIFLSTSAGQVAEVQRQLPALRRANMIVEPVGRNTAPAIGLAARVIAQQYPREVVVTINSDHFIPRSAPYLRALRAGERAARRLPERIILLGVKPTYPEVGYGYLQLGGPIGQGVAARRVVRFVEKPPYRRAVAYAASASYLWNSGLFFFYPSTLLALLARQAPRLARGLARVPVQQRAGRWVAGTAFSRLPAVSLDYAVLEHTKQLAALAGTFTWSDIGHWRAVYEASVSRAGQNVVRGCTYLARDSRGNLVYGPSGKLVATVGLHDAVIVDTPDALLVCSRQAAQGVRQLVAALKRNRYGRRYL